jgi:hypothetical protein
MTSVPKSSPCVPHFGAPHNAPATSHLRFARCNNERPKRLEPIFSGLESSARSFLRGAAIHSAKLNVIRGSASRNLVVQVDGESYVFDYSAAGHSYCWTPVMANQDDLVSMNELPYMPTMFWVTAMAVLLAWWMC